MKQQLQRVARSPLFFGVTYLCLIPLYALAYRFEPSLKTSPELNFAESIYFSAVTITTLGYGDVEPTSLEAKLVAASEAVVGIVIIGLFLNSIAQRSRYYQTAALEERVVELIHSLLLHHTFVIQTSTLKKIPQPRIRFAVLERTELGANMKGVHFRTPVPASVTTVGASVAGDLHKIIGNVNDLLKYVEYLHPDLIHIISNVESDQHIDRWLREYDADPITTQFGVIDPHSRDISSYASSFYNLHLMYHGLREFVEKRFYYNPSVRNMLMADAIVHEKKFEIGLSHARHLFEHPEYQKSAFFLAVVAYLKLGKARKAKKALGRYVAIGPENAEFVKGQIKAHYPFVTDEELLILLE